MKFLKGICRALIRGTVGHRLCRGAILNIILTPVEKAVHHLLHFGYLVDTGWINSCREGMPLGADNEPIPWLTYPAVKFLESRLGSTFDLYEFGTGNSTRFYAGRVATVTSVEHDSSWYRKVKDVAPENVSVRYCELSYGGDYCRTALADGRKYDVVIVDGRDRVNCLKQSLEALKQHGVVILDDSHRPQYEPGRAFMRQNGYRELDFWGVNAASPETSCTTIFYRQPNCLDI